MIDEERRRREHRQRWRLMRAAGQLLDFDRVRECHRTITRGEVDVMLDADTAAAHYSGLMTCGSRWHCAVCAAKRTEKDRRVLQHAMALWKRHGYSCYLLTFTFPHDITMPLDGGVKKMQRAQSRMKGWAPYKAIMAAAGAIGAVKALEVTYGENGWHPHVHMIVFAKPDQYPVFEGLRPIWAKAVEKVGLGKVNEHGFDVRGGDYAAEYVAKFGKEASDRSRKTARAWWSMSQEVTKGHMKQAQRLGGATPFTLLRWYMDNGDRQAGALFVEYAAAFAGRAQLYWSPGLRKHIDLLELQQPKKKRERPARILSLGLEDWHAVLRHDARWEVLYIAERYGAEAVAELLERMRCSRGRWRGEFKARDPSTGNWFPGYWRPPDFERAVA